MTDSSNIEEKDRGLVEGGRFRKKELINLHQKNAGIEHPLTVIEFSMMEEFKESLRKELEPFVTGDRKLETEQDQDDLKQIIENNLPPEVLDYFRDLRKTIPSQVKPYVYVIHNLPEIPEKEIEEKLNKAVDEACDPNDPEELEKAKKAVRAKLMSTSTYAQWIGNGIDLATNPGHKYHHGPLVRHAQHTSFEANQVEKHKELFGGFSVLFNKPGTKTKTKFIDLFTAAKTHRDVRANQLANDLLHVHEEIITDLTLEGRYGLDKESINKHSLDVDARSGTIVLFSNKGRLYHRALAAEDVPKDMKLNHVVRAAMYHVLDGYDPPQP